MKETELRIGNYISRPDLGDGKLRIEQIIELRQDEVIITGPVKVICSYNDLKPIPITKELLIKLGFENKGSFYRFKNSRFSEALIDYDESIGILVHSVLLKHIVYVHQLQNLHFVNTGEELTIKN